MEDSALNKLKSSYSTYPIEQLKKAIITYDRELARSSIDQIIANGINPIEALDALTEAIRLVGEAFGRDELFLPDLLSASDTMQSVMPVLENEISKSGKERDILGKVVLGTVLGDLHSIGKTMVGTLLSANGFKVYDLGIDVKSDKFIEAVIQYKPDVLAMSALLTTTAYEQKNVIEILKKKGLRNKIKIMVGGGAITEDFAKSIGADGYDPTAPGAVTLAKKLLGI
jgi:corrinoid protein of di/trimethylamine methyltransferase